MGDAGEDVHIWSVGVVGKVVTGVGEFDFDVCVELFWIGSREVVEFCFGEFFSVTAAAFGFVKTV
jgi:hypothetical protein